MARAEAAGGDVKPRDNDFSLFGSDDVSTNISLAHDLFLSELGRVVQVDPIQTMLKAPGTKRLKP